jgi:processed acidic surface protein
MKKFLMVIVSAVFVLLSSVPVFAAGLSDQLLAEYLDGKMTVKEFKQYLADYDYSVSEFGSVDDLRAEFGEPLTREHLDIYLKENNMTEEELTKILIDNGELEKGQSILDSEYLYFTSDLDFYVDDNEMPKDEDFALMKDEFYTEMKDMFDQMSITRSEYNALFDHVNSVRKGTDIMKELEKLNVLAEDMMSVGQFDNVDDLSEQEIAKILSIYDEIQRIFQVKFKYALIKDGVEREMSLQALVQMKDPGKASLKVYVYDLQGKQLLDLIITPDMFSDEIVKETGRDLKASASIVKQVAQKATVKHKAPVKTEMGGKLPKTAGDYVTGMLFGLLLLSGAILFLKKAGSIK